uniref:Uncharacterized protein n=1 Tax=Panagrellus redivivus TaxID=6233 RepID=A0A7E4UPV2_PANRE
MRKQSKFTFFHTCGQLQSGRMSEGLRLVTPTINGDGKAELSGPVINFSYLLLLMQTLFSFSTSLKKGF